MPSTFVPCPNVAEVSLQYLIQGGDIAENVFHVLDANPWNAASLTALLQTCFTWENTTTLGVLPKGTRSSSCSLVQGIARDLTTQTSAEVAASPSGGPIVGTAAGNPLNPGLALAVKHVTGVVGRSFRGRTFWIGLTIAEVTTDGTAMTSALAAGLVVGLNNLRLAIHASSSDLQMCVTSKYSGKDATTGRPAPRTTGLSTPTIGFALTDSFLDFQRRRQIAHARHH